MSYPPLQQLAVTASANYYQYLEEKDLSLIRVPVVKITHNPENDSHLLTLPKPIHHIQSICFDIKGKRYEQSQIPVLSYDEKKLILEIRPKTQYHDHIFPLAPKHIEIISDLKFLVKRVEEWHKAFGDRLSLPTTPSHLNPPTEFLQGYMPSEKQCKALDLVFSAPFSYIWGAPGTGKTQTVLAYSVIEYIRALQGQRDEYILLCAPTNLSLDQALFGVLPLLERFDIDTKNILRLGTPSAAFLSAYPQCCGALAADTKLKNIREQIAVLKQKKYFYNTKKLLADTGAIISLISEIELKEETCDNLEQRNEKIDSCIKTNETICTTMKKRLQKAEENAYNISKKLEKWHAPFLLPRQKKSIEDNLLAAHKICVDFETDIKELTESIITLRLERNVNLTKINKLQSKIRTCTLNANKLFVSRKMLEIAEKITKSTAKNVRARLLALQDECETYLDENGYTHTMQLDKDAIVDALTLLYSQQNDISKEIDKRMAESKVIACTIDTYCTSPLEKSPTHIFLDEAAYASLAKALCLFTQAAPITLLGDHMQLPPVCEANDEDFTKPSMTGVFLWAQSAIYIPSFFSQPPEKQLSIYLENEKPEFVELSKADLIETFRFSDKMAAILDEYVYQNGFTSARHNLQTEIVCYTATEERTENKSRENQGEVRAIKAYLEKENPQDYAIITPYKAQVRALSKAMKKSAKENRILTVHASQGQEWDTVIFSVADTTRLWFTNSCLEKTRGKEVINTAVSRAKKRLVLVCDKKLWLQKKGQFICGLLESANDFNP